MESLEDFYNQILDLDFLIEYGYYDRIATDEINQDVNDENSGLEENMEDQFYSVSDNFFPDYFSTKGVVTFLQDKKLGASIDDNFKISYDTDNILGGREHTHTDPIIFTIPKSNELSIRRTYKMDKVHIIV